MSSMQAAIGGFFLVFHVLAFAVALLYAAGAGALMAAAWYMLGL